MNLRRVTCFSCLTFFLISLPSWTATAEELMSSYTTCAVYHRMMAGAMRRKGNLDSLFDAEVEKMNFFVERAKKLNRETYGEELGDEIFNDEWAAIQLDMTDKINRNYDNVSKLRLRYKENCEMGL